MSMYHKFLSKWFCLLCVVLLVSCGDSDENTLGDAEDSSLAKQDFKPVYGIETFELKNGLKVYVLENPRIPVVAHTLVYKVGSADDPLGKSGLAHFHEHMMFKGPEGEAAAKIWDFTQKVGGAINAATSYNETYYFEIVPKEHLEEIMRLEAMRMQNLTVLESEVEAERQVIIEERYMRLENNPFALFLESLNATFYRHHPYRIHPIGWLHEMRALGADDVRQFHKKWYVVNNAFLILSGDISLQEAKLLAEKHYGSIAPAKPVTRKRVQEPPRRVKQAVTMKSEQVVKPTVSFIFPATPFDQNEPKKSFALATGLFALSNSATGKLYERLVEDLKVASEFYISYDQFALDYSDVTIYAEAAQDIAVEDLKAIILREIRAVIEAGITKDVLDAAVKQRIAGLDFLKDSLQGGADQVIRPIAAGMPLEDLEKWPVFLTQLTAEDINLALHLVFSEPHYLEGCLEPETQKEENSESAADQDAEEKKDEGAKA